MSKDTPKSDAAGIVPPARALTQTFHYERSNYAVCRFSDDDGALLSVAFHLDPASSDGDISNADFLLDALNRAYRELNQRPDKKTVALESLAKSSAEILAELKLIGPALNGIARGVNKK